MYGEFAKLYDALMADVDYDAWAGYLAGFLPEGASVAECACGTGEITLRLQKRGFRLTGVDISREMLEIADEKARMQGLRIPFVCMDMRRLRLHRPVDAVVCACDGVNYLSSRGALDAFFGAAAAALRPGGLLLFDVSSRYKLEHVLGSNTFAHEDAARAYIWKNCYDAQNHLIEMRLRFFEREGELYRSFCETHIQRAHSEREIRNALSRAGFQEVCAYEAFGREAPDERSERVQYAARKGV